MPDGTEPQVIRLTIPKKLGFLMESHPYKVAYGGRFGLKTRSFAKALLAKGAAKRIRWLCCREIMLSIKDSVHEELKGVIEAEGLGSFYDVLDNEIRGKNGTVIIFAGLHGHSVESIKSYANLDGCWVEEGQGVTKRSWTILIPTIRKTGAEIWVSFNPDMDTDDTWLRWVVNPLPDAIVVKTGWRDAAELGWFPASENAKRLHCQQFEPDDYENIWEGVPRSTVVGAIYSREVMAMIEDGRARPMPYDPRLPVHTIWDLGWNDAMSIIMVQKPVPSVVNIINYLEDSQRTYAQYVTDLNRLPYLWGTDWLPHDGKNRDPKSGKSAQEVLQGLGRKKVRLIGQGDVEDGIRLARMMFPRVYIDNTEKKRDTGHLGCARLLECLKRYKRHVPKNTLEPSTPVHDQYSHGADAYRGLAMIVDQIRNEGERLVPTLPGFSPQDSSVGMMG